MKNTIKNYFIALFLLGAAFSCNPDESVTPAEELVGTGAFIGESCDCPDPVNRTAVVIGNQNGGDFFITSDVTWTCNNTYILRGKVRVKDGATLTIEPGTIVKGNSPLDKVLDRDKAGFLVITKTGAINAEGTCDCPIVFTSRKSRGNRARGDWGGLLLAGNGLVTVSNGSGVSNLEGFLAGEEQVPYGGDNSVIAPLSAMSFVRIEFAGIDVSGGGGNETNSLTMGGIQRNVYTVMDHIQVSEGGDDGFEWFGGDVDMKYLYSFKGTDDDFDLDQGYAGRVQFGVALRARTLADNSQSNGFESDGIISSSSCDFIPGNGGATTTASFSNITGIGSINNATNPTPWPLLPSALPATFGAAIHIREGSNMKLANSLLGGWPTAIRMSNEPTFDNFNANPMFVRNLLTAETQFVLDGCGTINTVAAQEARYNFLKNGYVPAKGRVFAVQFLGLNPEATKMTMPKMVPIAYKTQVDFSQLDPWFTPTTYRGAFGPNDATAGWCSDTENNNPRWMEFNPNNAEYGTN
ncbi:MAG: hypothetical protein HC819_16680 [Cyclobacteriaceae bacterium]|nr:hypothetical protein [Cyclobacteriaceae bacterium]